MPVFYAVLCLWVTLLLPVQAAEAPLIAAASNLQFALTEIAEAYASKTGKQVRLVFGSSGNFSRQIRQQAPFELFMAADQSYIRALHADGLTQDAGKVYAIGRLALAVPEHSSLQADATLADLKAALADGRLNRFSIANPEHAPYGSRARQALEYHSLWQSLQHTLILGENVGQAAQFALSSNAQGGIIAWSQAQSPTLKNKAQFVLLPAQFHQPLLQQMVLLKNSGSAAAQFYQYLQHNDAITILQSYGFEPPDPPEQ